MSSGAGSLEGLVIAVAALVGLFVGSFLNVVVYRAPRGLSVSTPRSFCPTCDRQLAWWENIPLVSWAALRGKCHTCHEPISVRYPLVEATTAVVFALVAWAWHGSSLSAGYCVLSATAIAVGLIEAGGMRAPLSVGATGGALGQALIVACAAWLERWAVLGWSLAGLLAGSLVFAVLRVRDPDCRDPWGHGRTLLPVAGCWLGGLGGRPTVAGLAGWIVGAFGCLVVLWAGARRDRSSDSERRDGGWFRSVVSVPLVTGIVVAMAVSLTVAG